MDSKQRQPSVKIGPFGRLLCLLLRDLHQLGEPFQSFIHPSRQVGTGLVELCAVWPTQNWLGFFVNQIQGRIKSLKGENFLCVLSGLSQLSPLF